MALDESIDGLEKMISNGINVFIDPRLKDHLIKFGGVLIDFTTSPTGQSGYSIKIGNTDDCSSGGCSGCG